MSDRTALQERYFRVKSPREKGKQRRREIYEFICTYANEMPGPTPTINEVATALELDYKVTYYHVMKLIAGGYLKQERGKLVIVGGEWTGPDYLFA